VLWDGSRQRKRAPPVNFGSLWLYRRAFLPRTFLGGPPAVFSHKKDIYASLWDAMCTYHPDASRTKCTHRTHEGHPPKTADSYLQKYPQYCYSIHGNSTYIVYYYILLEIYFVSISIIITYCQYSAAPHVLRTMTTAEQLLPVKYTTSKAAETRNAHTNTYTDTGAD